MSQKAYCIVCVKVVCEDFLVYFSISHVSISQVMFWRKLVKIVAILSLRSC